MKPINILLVEDNEGDVLLIKEALSEKKIIHNLIHQRDGERAWDYLQNISLDKKEADMPDLAILDINVPKLNGLQLLQKIKADEKLKTVPVIILTTSSSLSDIQKAYEGYANCYITKPVDVNDFLNVVLSIENFWLSIVQLPKH